MNHVLIAMAAAWATEIEFVQELCFSGWKLNRRIKRHLTERGREANDHGSCAITFPRLARHFHSSELKSNVCFSTHITRVFLNAIFVRSTLVRGGIHSTRALLTAPLCLLYVVRPLNY